MTAPVSKPARLDSLDALRGFAMFWIVGADAFSGALHGLNAGLPGRVLAGQLDHASWAGFHFYDLIFPLFLFVVGTAIPLSLDRLVATDGLGPAHRRILRRGALMFLLGLLYYGGLDQGFAHLRLLGVLQRIALCYVAASLLYLHLRPRGLAVVGGALLVGYWVALRFVPVPGYGAGDFAERHNLANWFDSQFLPLRQWKGDHDPEGILSTFPAIASCLLGVFAGLLLRDPARAPRAKLTALALAGVALLAAGWLWSLDTPVIKRLWTSPYVLVAGGWSALLLAAFYALIDVRGWRAWATPFVWIGANALTIYLVSNVVDFAKLSARFTGGEIASALDALWPGLGGLALALTGVGLCVALCRFLHVRKIFLRL